MRAKTRKEKKHEAESRLNYHLEQYRLLFSQNGCSCSLPAKGLASAPKIYRSKHFQVCTHPRLQCPLIWNPYVGACRSATCCDIGFLQPGRWPRECRTKIYPKAVIGRSPSGLGVGGLGSTLSLRVLLAPPPNRNFDELFLWPNFPDPESLHSPHPAHSCGFHNTVAAWLKQSSPDRSITNLHSQQSVTDSMPTKPLAIHYCEAVQGEACPTAAC